MPTSLSVALSLSLSLSLAADGGAPPVQAPSPGPAAATSTAAQPLPPAPSPAAPVRSAAAVEPAGRTALVPGAETTVDPRSTFEVELPVRAPDARLVLVDARDDQLPAAGTRELAAGTRLTVAPAAPLVPGSRYALRLDGATERDLHDAAGRPLGPVTWPLLAAGTPPPPEARKKPAKKRRRR